MRLYIESVPKRRRIWQQYYDQMFIHNFASELAAIHGPF